MTEQTGTNISNASPGYGFKCSVCQWEAYITDDYGVHIDFDDFNYCPRCGIPMAGAEGAWLPGGKLKEQSIS